MLIYALLFIIFYTPFICARTYNWIIPVTISFIFIIFLILLIVKKPSNIFRAFPYNFNLSVCLFVLAIILSTVFSRDTYLSTIELIKMLSGIGLCYLVASGFSLSKREIAIKVILIGALLIMLYGFYQYFIGFSDTLRYIESNKLDIPYDELVEIKKNLTQKRIFSTFLNPNSYAGYLLMILPLLWAQVFGVSTGHPAELGRGRAKFSHDPLSWVPRKPDPISILFSFGLILSLILTKSFGGFLTILFSLAVFFYILFRKKTKLFSKYRYRHSILPGILILCIILFVVLLFLRQGSIFNFNDPNNSIMSRFNYWKGTINIIKEYPLTGTGLGTFGKMYPKFKLPDAGNTEYAHNFYIQFASESGLIGIMSISILIFSILKILIKNCSSPGLIVAISGFLIHNIVDFDFYMWDLNIVFWFLVGLGISEGRTEGYNIHEVSNGMILKLFKKLKTYFMDNTDRFLEIGIVANLFYTGFAKAGRGIIATNISFFITLILSLLLILKIITTPKHWNWVLKKEGFNVPSLSINSPVIVFLIILFFSSIFSLNKHSGTIEIFKILNFGMSIYIVFSYIKELKQIRRIVFSIITIAFLLSLYALLKGIFLDNLTTRIHGNFPNSNLLAGFLSCALILIINILIYCKDIKKIWKFLLAFSGITIFTSFVLTGSRGGFLSFFAGLMISILIYIRARSSRISLSRKTAFLSLFIIFIVIIFVAIKTPMGERIFQPGKIDKLAYKRIEIWNTAIKMIKERPIIGTGLGTYGDVYNKYAFPIDGYVGRYGRYTRFAHNEYLHISAEIGVFALLAFLWFIFLVLKLKPIHNGESIGIYCAIISILAHSIVDFNLHLTFILLLFGILIGMHLSLCNRRVDSESIKRQNVLSRTGLYFFIIFILVFIVLFTTTIGYIYSEVGSRHKKNKDYPNAIKNYNIAVKLDPISAEYYDSLGNIYETIYLKTMDNKFLLLSEKNFLSACKLNKTNGYFRKHLGFLYLTGFNITKDIELLKKAVNIYNEAIKLNPYNPFFVLELGVVYANFNDFHRAEICFKKAIELEPNYISAHRNLAVVAKRLNEVNLAKYERSIVDKLIKSNLKPISDYEKSLLEVERGD